MNDQVHEFRSRHGTLIVKPEGITVKRTWKQALQSGRLLAREQFIPYSHLSDVKQDQFGSRKGMMRFDLAPGTPGRTPLHRRATLKYSPHDAHNFRQAQKLIEDRLAAQPGPDSQAHADTYNPERHLNRAGLPFRRGT